MIECCYVWRTDEYNRITTKTDCYTKIKAVERSWSVISGYLINAVPNPPLIKMSAIDMNTAVSAVIP